LVSQIFSGLSQWWVRGFDGTNWTAWQQIGNSVDWNETNAGSVYYIANKPTIGNGTLTVTDGTNTYTFTANQTDDRTIDLSTLAFSGDYSDLVNAPTFKTVAGESIIGTGDISFNTLNGNSLKGTGDISLKTVGGNDIIGSGDISLPVVNDGTLTINPTATDIPSSASFTANQSGNTEIGLGLGTMAYENAGTYVTNANLTTNYRTASDEDTINATKLVKTDIITSSSNVHITNPSANQVKIDVDAVTMPNKW